MTVFLADPYLSDTSGHCLGYLTPLERAFRERGREVVVLGSQRISDDLKQAGVHPAFAEETIRPSGGAPLSRLFFGPPMARALRRDLSDARGRFGFGSDDLLLINSLRPEHLPAVAEWLRRLPATSRPQLCLPLHFTSQPKGRPKRKLEAAYRAGFRILSRSGFRAVILADTAELVEEMRDLGAPQVGLAPIPHCRPSPLRTRPIGPLTLAFVGQARPEKGFHLLPDALSGIAGDVRAGRIRVLAQAHAPCAGSILRETITSLSELGVLLYRDPLAEAEYASMLGRADIILMPYDRHPYHRQSSGVFAEAVAAGKVVIVPDGTWMGRQIGNDASGVCYSPEKAGDLTQAVSYAVKNWVELSNGAAEKTERWLGFHNPERFLELVEGA